MKKIMSISIFAGMTTFALFAFMAFLIRQDHRPAIVVDDTPIVEVYQGKEETPPQVKTRVTLTPPPMPEPAPPMKLIEAEPATIDAVNYSLPSIDLGPSTGIGGHITEPDKEARPVIRVNPKYPRVAANNGIEGWVVLSFDINKLGQVMNVKVIESQPKKVFDSAAKRALKKWKYRAKINNGQPVAQENLTVQLDFNIEQQS